MMRGSLQKLLEGLCHTLDSHLLNRCIFLTPWSLSGYLYALTVVGTRSLSMADYMAGLENSGWLRHIKAIMDAAIFLAKVKLGFGLVLMLISTGIIL